MISDPAAIVRCPPPARLGISGSAATFEVGRIWCVGRNYADHVREMGGDPDRVPPTFFAKAPGSLLPGGGAMPYPPRTADLHHEVELVVALQRGGRDIPAASALEHVFGYAVGIDLTRRDLQNAAKATAGPWDLAKSFDGAAPVSAIRPAAEIGHPDRGRIELLVDGASRQQGDLGAMIWSVPEIVATLSTFLTLQPGDLIFTGTPEGVGPVRPGPGLAARIDGVGALQVRIEGG